MIRIGHVHLKVGEIGRPESFYLNLLGARVSERLVSIRAFARALSLSVRGVGRCRFVAGGG